MVWQEGASLAEQFEEACVVHRQLLGHQRQPGKTYQGWVKAWVKWSPRLLALVMPHLRALIQTMALASGDGGGGGCWMIDGWVLMGCDGTRIDAPRTADNEAAFGCGGKKKTTPQLWLTTVMHLATGLPWCWKIGKADASERGHLRQMLGLLPAMTLLIADAGYTGFSLLTALIEAEHHFLIRVGANVHLLTTLGYDVREYDGIVYLWPQGQRQRGVAPLVLRLIRLHDGRRPMCLLTNVLDPRKLSDRQAARFYRLRWGLELWYRAMKQTLRRRKLHSHAPVQAALELRWAIVGLACLGLLQVRALLERGLDPHHASAAGALRVVRAMMRQPQRRLRRGQDLPCRLRGAVLDDYQRKAPKTARDWPHPKKEKPPGCPQLRPATEAEIQAAQQLPRRNAA